MDKSRFTAFFARKEHRTDAANTDGTLSVMDQGPTEFMPQAEVFSNLMEIAHQIVRHDPGALPGLVSAILRPLQAEQIISVAERKQHGALDAIQFKQFFSSEYFFSFSDPNDCVRLPSAEYSVDLSRDIVLTTPWVRTRFVAALAHIGYGKLSGSWRQDSNHSITLVLPWRIAFVNGGNHSIAAGILGHEGLVVPSEVYDLSPVFARVICDGTNFVCRITGNTVAQPRDGRMAALFEIGRLMTDASSRQAGIEAAALG